MITILFTTIFIIPVLMGLGKIAENIFGSLIGGISGKILSGIMAISIVWTALAFFVPLNIYVEAITIIIGLFYFFKEKLYLDFYRFSKQDGFITGPASLFILFSGSYYPYILDHFGYYVPTIKWLTEYGLVKGISNLDLTLGQMSAWHIFQAGFSNFSDPFLRINTVLLIVYVMYIVEKKSWIQLCFLPVLFLFLQSPSPDLPVIIFSLVILNEILSGNKKTSLIFGFSIFIFTIKPTMIWVPVLSFLYSALITKSNIKSFTLGIVIILLFFVKNIWTFGYPVFPVAIGDFGVNWKPAPEVLKISSQYAILKTYDMQYPYEEIQKFSGMDHIKNWLFLKGIKSKINILFIISLLIFVIFTFIKKNKIITLICISLIIKSAMVLFFSAQYRFFIDVFFVIFFVMFCDYFTKRKSMVIFSFMSIFFVTFLSLPNLVQQYVPSFRLGSFLGKFEKEQLYKPSVYRYSQFNSFRVGNLKFNVTKKYPYNFDTQIPAVSTGFIFDDSKAGIFPRLIDEQNIRKGFIYKKTNPTEQKEVEKVINTIENSYK